MTGAKRGVVKQMQQVEPRAIYLHIVMVRH